MNIKAQKPCLILLPGLSGTSGLFNPLIACLQDHFTILPASYPTDEKLSYLELASFVEKKLDSVSGKYFILAESFSGPVSILISERKPAGLCGLILVATFITAPNIKVGRFLPWTLGFSLARPLYSIRLALSKAENQSLIAAIATELQSVSPQVLSSRIAEVFAVDVSDIIPKLRGPSGLLSRYQRLRCPQKERQNHSINKTRHHCY